MSETSSGKDSDFTLVVDGVAFPVDLMILSTVQLFKDMLEHFSGNTSANPDMFLLTLFEMVLETEDINPYNIKFIRLGYPTSDFHVLNIITCMFRRWVRLNRMRCIADQQLKFSND